MQSVFEIITDGEGTGRRRQGRRSGQPIRRDSYTARGREGRFWQPFDRNDTGRIMKAAERYECAGRIAARAERTGTKNGPLGHLGLEVLRYMLHRVDWRTGRLDPSLARIAQRIGRSVRAVVNALQRLRAHGFLDWLRRYEPTGNAEGPQVKQATNAYRLALPPRAAQLLPSKPPLPDDEEHRQRTRAAAVRLMIAALPLDEQASAMVDEGQERLGRALDSIAARIMARDAVQGQTEPRTIDVDPTTTRSRLGTTLARLGAAISADPLGNCVNAQGGENPASS